MKNIPALLEGGTIQEYPCISANQIARSASHTSNVTTPFRNIPVFVSTAKIPAALSLRRWNQWEPWRATVRQLREHVWSSEQAVPKDLDTDITLLCQSVQIRRRCQTACDEFCEGGRTARQKIRDRFDEGIKLVFGENARRHEREATPTPLRGTVAK